MKGKLKKFIVIALMAACVIVCLSLGVANMKVSWADAEKTAIAASSETGTGKMGYVITDQNGEILETFDENGNVTGEDAENSIMTLDSYYDYSKDGVTWTWETVDGVRTWTSCSGYGSNLVVPSYDPEESSLNDYVSNPVVAVGEKFLKDDTKIKTVTFSEGDTRIIGEYAFSDCSNLESVDTGNSVTTIGSHAFGDCSKLKSVTIGKNVTSIGTYAFHDCEILTEIYYNAVIVEDLSGTYFWVFSEAGQSGSGITVTFGPNVTHIPSGLFDVVARSDYSYAKPKIKTIIFEDNSKLKSIAGFSFGTCCDTVDVYITDIAAWCETDFMYSSVSNTTSVGSPFNCSNLYLNNKLVEDLVIPSGVTSINSYAFRSCYSIKHVEIPNSVTSIGDGAFYSCKSLESVEIPSGVTEINYRTFYKCTGLTSVTIPDSVTTIGGSSFMYCTSLTSVTIPDSVTTIGNAAFSCCELLATLTLPKELTYIGSNAFDGCACLKSLTIPEKVTYIGDYAFGDCTSLTKINFNAVAVQNKSSGSQVFYKAGQSGSGITLTIGKSVTKIPAYLFCAKETTQSSYAINITTVKFEDGSKCESIGKYAFAYNCQYLTSITIPYSVTEIGKYAFYYTKKLSSVIFEDPTGWYRTDGKNRNSLDSDSLSDPSTAATYLSSTYYKYDWYQKLPEEFEYTLSSDGTYYILTKFNNKNSTYTDVVMDATYEALPVKEIAASVFEEHTEITSVTISENITTIGEYAFYNCTGLTSVTIPDSVTTIGEYAFDGCTGLTSLTIGEGVITIGAYAFRCKYLTKINFNAVAMDDLSSKNQVFYNAGDSGSGIAVTIGANVTKIPAYLFFPYSTTLTTHTPSYTSVEFMSGSKCTSIGKYAFYSCSHLKSMEIPDSVTSIGNYAFHGCSGLTSLTIGTGVTSIGTYVFYGCSSLTSVTFKNTEGWSCSYSITTIDMDSSDLSNTSTAATYLTSTYYKYTWTRTEGAGFTYRLSSDGTYYILESYVGRSTSVTVEGTHNGLPVKEIGPYAFEGNTRMMGVVISENITAIGEGAFYCCTLLMSVEFPSTLVTIGDLAFAGCTVLLAVEFPSSLVSIGEGAFLGSCLAGVVFSSGLESIGGYAFAGTYLLQLYVDDLASFLAIDFADSYANPLSVLSENGGTFYVGGLETTKLTA
ncbi:MAG: leucine-rich repeat domain-containing protein, partial [Bacteroidales bacterium]|nr:leucine-rich repeat domain-containing protein [Bacteroidales bacterium]